MTKQNNRHYLQNKGGCCAVCGRNPTSGKGLCQRCYNTIFDFLEGYNYDPRLIHSAVEWIRTSESNQKVSLSNDHDKV